MPNFRQRGFTFIEIAITVAIIVIVSVVVYANYNDINNAGEVYSVSEKVKENIRLAQNFAMTGRMFKYKAPVGWGVALDRASGDYTVFGDLNSNKLYDYPVKLLIHGYENLEDAGSPTFRESSNKKFLVTKGDGITGSTFPELNTEAGQPSGDGYWYLDGTQYFQVNYDSDFNFIANDFTFDLWFKADGLSSTQYLLAQSQSFALMLNNANYLALRLYDSLGNTINVVGSLAVNDTNWHHAAATRVGSRVYLFLDGQTAAVSDIGSSTAMRNMNGKIYIGALDDVSVGKWKGALDEIRIVNGWGQWFEKFTLPTTYHNTDEERYRSARLSPGMVFERLHLGATTTNNLNIYFSPSSYLMYGNANSGNEDIRIIINRRGAEKTGLAGDTPREFIILPSGLVSSSKAN